MMKTGNANMSQCLQGFSVLRGTTANGGKMKTGELKLWFDGKHNRPVRLVEKVNGGWIIKTLEGLTIGPIEDNSEIGNILR
jgi:hypothetical protein